MKTIKIRELRGSTLEASARADELVGLTRDRALIAVVIPMGQAWVEHLVEQNWSRVMQSVATAEAELSSGAELSTLEDVLDTADSTVDESAAVPEPRPLASPSGTSRSTAAASASVEGPVSELQRLTAALGAATSSPGEPAITSSTTIRVRDLSATRIDQAGENRELLVLTNDRALIGIVVPVSPRLVEFLVTQNISRVMWNIQQAETELDKLGGETLDDTLNEAQSTPTSPDAPSPSPSPSMLRRRREQRTP